jgi:tyrosine-protein kinase Etk/Wzc
MQNQLPSGPGAADGGVPAESLHPQAFAQAETYYGDDAELRDVWATLRRRRRTILGTVTLVVAAVATWTWYQTPVWQASTLIRVDEAESGGVPVLDVLASLQRGSELETEMRILRTRPIAEEVVDALDLNFLVANPQEVPRELFFSKLALERDTPEAEYWIRRTAPGRYALESSEGDEPTFRTEFSTGESVRIAGGSFAVANFGGTTSVADEPIPDVIEIHTIGFQDAVDRLAEALTVTRPDREANVVRVAYETTDRILSYEVPNAIARAFIEQRNEIQKTEVRSTVDFLQAQSEQIQTQLEAAEEELQSFREGRQIVALGVEAEAQVQRLAELQTQRTQLDAERAALANLLREIDEETGRPSYRRLAAFPTFLENDAIADILRELISADRARTELSVRVTPAHPDLIAVTNRIIDLEEQLGAIGRNYLGSLDDQIASLDAVLARFGSELEQIPEKEVQFARLERQTSMLAELYTLLQTRLKEAQVAEAVEDPAVRVVETAILPIDPISPRPFRNMALAGILGLMLGVGLAFVREYMDTRLHSSDQIEHMYGLPTIARVPEMSLGNGAGGRRNALVTLTQAHSVGAESFRNLRTNVRFVRAGQGATEMVVTSPAPQEGKSVTAANLAIALAQQGMKTLLVDADMRRSVQHRQFGLETSPGLSDLLVEDEGLESILKPTTVENLDVLTAGKHPPNPAELVGSPRMEVLLDALRERYDTIVIDSPPMLAVTDASVLGKKTDGVILVVRAEKTEKDSINLAIQQLRHVGARILGVVVNDAKPDGPYYSYYRKYYGEEQRRRFTKLLPRA